MGAHSVIIGIALVCVRGLLSHVPPSSALPAPSPGPDVAIPSSSSPKKFPEGTATSSSPPPLADRERLVQKFTRDRERFTGTPVMSPTQAPLPPPSLPCRLPTAPETVTIVTRVEPSAPPTPASRGQGSPAGGQAEEDTTMTVITTTTVTTVQGPAHCDGRMVAVEGLIESLEYSSSPFYSGLHCSFIISAYPGFGIELEVKSLTLLEGELLTVEGLRGDEPLVVANEALMLEGQIMRSNSRVALVHFQSSRSMERGTFQLQCRAYLLSCAMPVRPLYGDVRVSDLYPGGTATFQCDAGFELQGAMSLTCLNLTTPQWNSPAPQCLAVCGATIPNATVGHILAPDYTRNHGNNITCHWLIQAPKGQRIHLHFERLSLDEDSDRLIIRSGNFLGAPLTFHSDIDDVPDQGVVSDSQDLFIELVSENSRFPLLLALRYEAFDGEHCYEPFLPHGNFSSSDPTFGVGARVEFRCNQGYALKQGPATIHCVDTERPHWNETEPVCKATCGGDMAEPSGVIVSPEWPELYRNHQDCVWYLHVPIDKRIVIEIEILNIRRDDVLSIFDGSELNSRILGQYMGSQKGLRLFSSSSDVTVQFQSDSEGAASGESHGFIIHFAETARNDTCQALGPIADGWKTVSHSNLIRGTVVTYQCELGYHIVGSEILMCQWDLSWSNAPPSCKKTRVCRDPGEVPNGLRLTPGVQFPVGTKLQYVCERGHHLQGNGTIVCTDPTPEGQRPPRWSRPLPRCVLTHAPCSNPGVPENGYQTLYKQEYRPGESLRFFCYEGFELIGSFSITCLAGPPSRWSSPPPFCKVNYEEIYNERQLQVSRTTDPSNQMEGGNIVMAIVLPIILVIVLIGGIYLYYSKLQGKPFVRLPLSNSPSYTPITMETDYNNPLYEAGDTQEYEVSI